MSAQGGDQCFLNCKIENVKFGNNAKMKKEEYKTSKLAPELEQEFN